MTTYQMTLRDGSVVTLVSDVAPVRAALWMLGPDNTLSGVLPGVDDNQIVAYYDRQQRLRYVDLFVTEQTVTERAPVCLHCGEPMHGEQWDATMCVSCAERKAGA